MRKEVDAQLAKFGETQPKLDYFRFQIDMRVIGLAWDQFTVTQLRKLLVEEILPYEHAERRLKRRQRRRRRFTVKDIGSWARRTSR